MLSIKKKYDYLANYISLPPFKQIDTKSAQNGSPALIFNMSSNTARSYYIYSNYRATLPQNLGIYQNQKSLNVVKQILLKECKINRVEYFDVPQEKIIIEIIEGPSKIIKSIKTGATTMVFETTQSNQILGLTTDSLKSIWLDRNPYAKGNILAVVPTIPKRVLYIYKMPKYKKPSTSQFKILDKIQDYDIQVHDDYGYMIPIRKNVEYLLEYMREDNFLEQVPREIISQLKLVRSIFYKIPVTKGTLDIHSGQWGVSQDKRIVLFDPIYSENARALKVGNRIDPDRFL